MAKKYFDKVDGEMCYTLDYYRDKMKFEGIEEMTLIESKPKFGSGFFWCKVHCFVGDKNEGTCGKLCDDYKPRNGKSGRCVHSANCYEPTDIEITISA